MGQDRPLGTSGRARRVADQRRRRRVDHVEGGRFAIGQVDVGTDDQHVRIGGVDPPRRVIPVHQGSRGPGVSDHVGQLRLAVGGVGRHDHQTQTERGQVGGDQAGGRGGAAQQSIPRSQAGPMESPGDRGAAFGEVAPAEPPGVGGVEHRAVGFRGRSRRDHRWDGSPGEEVDVAPSKPGRQVPGPRRNRLCCHPGVIASGHGDIKAQSRRPPAHLTDFPVVASVPRCRPPCGVAGRPPQARATTRSPPAGRRSRPAR